MPNLFGEVEVFTIGYAGRTLAEFQAALAAHQIDLVVDIRRSPNSRRFPWFNRKALEESLGDRYQYEGALGNSKDAVGRQWLPLEVDGAMRAVRRLQLLVEGGRKIALMCAEKDPRDCHRSQVAKEVCPNVVHIP